MVSHHELCEGLPKVTPFLHHEIQLTTAPVARAPATNAHYYNFGTYNYKMDTGNSLFLVR